MDTLNLNVFVVFMDMLRVSRTVFRAAASITRAVVRGLTLVAVLALVVYQKMDLNRMQQTEQCIARRMRAVDRALWTRGQADEESDVMTDYYITDRSGDVIPPTVKFALESLRPHPVNRNYVQLQYSTFQMPVEGE